jgi:hypothetical protein
MIYSNIDVKYHYINEIIFNIYKESRFFNFYSFFENIKSQKNIIYTFSKITEILFNEEIKIKNKFGVFTKQNATIEMIESIKSENDLIFLLKTFANSNNKKLLILKFTENDINKINSVNHVLNNYEKENKINDKLILFIIHRER